MNIFEYKVIEFGSKRAFESLPITEKELNDFGKDGWELVSFFTNSSLGPTKYNLVGLVSNNTAIFKRKKVSADGAK